MKIIDAFWEKRNLDIECYEIEFESKDTLEYIYSEMDALIEREYMVLKVPSDRFDILYYVQSKGYIFTEAAITLELKKDNLFINNRLQNIVNKCTWAEMNLQEIDEMYIEIDKNIFCTDRIFTDSKFTHAQSAKRYKYWINDLIKNDNIPYIVKYDNEKIGFFISKQINPKTYHGVLAGTYLDYKSTGLGFCIQYAGVMHAFENGIDKYIGSVSANNPAVLKILCSMGFTVKNIQYVLIKHNL